MDPKRALPRQYHRGQTALPLHLEWHWAEPDKLSLERYSFRSSASKPVTLSRKKPRSAPGAGTDLPWPKVGGSAVKPPPLQACRVLQSPTACLELAPTLASCNAASFPVERLLERWALGTAAAPHHAPLVGPHTAPPSPFPRACGLCSDLSLAELPVTAHWIFSLGEIRQARAASGVAARTQWGNEGERALESQLLSRW